MSRDKSFRQPPRAPQGLPKLVQKSLKIGLQTICPGPRRSVAQLGHTKGRDKSFFGRPEAGTNRYKSLPGRSRTLLSSIWLKPSFNTTTYFTRHHFFYFTHDNTWGGEIPRWLGAQHDHLQRLDQRLRKGRAARASPENLRGNEAARTPLPPTTLATRPFGEPGVRCSQVRAVLGKGG